jgi:O-acetyl-ADP-ribose deacetylase (regulator of RNase III)
MAASRRTLLDRLTGNNADTASMRGASSSDLPEKSGDDHFYDADNLKSLPPLPPVSPPAYDDILHVAPGTPASGKSHGSSTSSPPFGAVPASAGTMASKTITVDLAATVSPQFALYCAKVPAAMASIKTEISRRLQGDHVTFILHSGSTYVVGGAAHRIQTIGPDLVELLQKIAESLALTTLPLDPVQAKYLTANDSHALKTLEAAHPSVSFHVIEESTAASGPAHNMPLVGSDNGTSTLAAAAAARAKSRPATTFGQPTQTSQQSLPVTTAPKPAVHPEKAGEGFVGTVVVRVMCGNWKQLGADAIVRPATASSGGVESSLARSISAAAGARLTSAIAMHKPPVPVGRAVVVPGFDLVTLAPAPINHVVHAVVPAKSAGPVTAAEQTQLKNLVTHTLAAANMAGATTLALPALGSESGWSIDVAANCVVGALVDFGRSASTMAAVGRKEAVKTVVLFDDRGDVVDALVRAMLAAAAAPTVAPGPLTASPGRATIQAPTHQWGWRNDVDGVTEYDYDQNQQLEVAYKRWTEQDPAASSVVRISGDVAGRFSDSKNIPENFSHPVYDVDFTTMQQRNAASGFLRAVQRTPLAEGSYPPQTPASVIAAIADSESKAAAAMAGQASGANVAFSLVSFQRVAVATGHPIGQSHSVSDLKATASTSAATTYATYPASQTTTGSVRHLAGSALFNQPTVPATAAPNPGAATKLRPLSTAAAVPVSTPMRSAGQSGAAGPVLEIYGPKFNAAKALNAMRDHLARAVQTAIVAIPELLDGAAVLLPQLAPLAARHHVTATVEPGTATATDPTARDAIKLSAYGALALKTAELALQQEFNVMLTTLNKVPNPPEWTGKANNDDKKAVLVDLVPGTDEYSRVAQQFAHGNFTKPIIAIQRVQNRHLWVKFFERRRVVMRENNDNANEAYMKHGTRACPPSTIYDGTLGFDFRYAAEGYFGRGAYFAEQAEYSHDYRHNMTSEPGQAQMFLALVVRGRIDDHGDLRDSNIKHPLNNCHSVQGMVTTTHRAIITYELHQAYPSYLITYLV